MARDRKTYQFEKRQPQVPNGYLVRVPRPPDLFGMDWRQTCDDADVLAAQIRGRAWKEVDPFLLFETLRDLALISDAKVGRTKVTKARAARDLIFGALRGNRRGKLKGKDYGTTATATMTAAFWLRVHRCFEDGGLSTKIGPTSRTDAELRRATLLLAEEIRRDMAGSAIQLGPVDGVPGEEWQAQNFLREYAQHPFRSKAAIKKHFGLTDSTRKKPSPIRSSR